MNKTKRFNRDWLTLTILRSGLASSMEQWLGRWIPNLGDPGSKQLGCSEVHSAFHLSEVDQMSTRNFWGLSGEK